MRVVVGVAFLFVATAAFVHCRAPDATAVAESPHTAGEIANDNVPFAWAETDYASYQEAAGERGSTVLQGSTVLPADSPITVRLQAWVDVFDAAARAIVKESGHELAAPRPTVVTLNSLVRNAWASGVPACLGGPVDLTHVPRTRPFGLQPSTFPVRKSASIIGGTVFLSTVGCAEPKNWASADGIVWANARATGCHFEPVDGGLSVRGQEGDAGTRCEVSSYEVAPNLTTVDKATLSTTSNFIHVTTSFLASVPDEQVAAIVIAHELSHYYRAHSSGLREYNYFYEQKSPPLPGIPAAVADSQELRIKLYSLLYPSAPPPPIANTRFSPRLRQLMLMVIRAFAAPSSGPAVFDPVCTALPATAAPWEAILSSPFALSPEAEAAYVALESRFMECTTKTMVGAAGAAHLSVEAMRAGLQYFPTLGWVPATEPETLAAIFARLQERAAALDVETTAYLAEINARHLGIYSIEQEADDMAMELLARAGVDPKEHVEAWLRYIRRLAENPSTASILGQDGLSVDECITLYRDGWTRSNANGIREPAFVPLGNLLEPHHGYCYRLFNLSRELDAHHYAVGANSPVAPEPPWSTIMSAVNAAVATLPTGSTSPAPAPSNPSLKPLRIDENY